MPIEHTNRSARAVNRHTIAAALSAVLPLLLCAPAHAQSVLKCQIDGRTVFQSSPCPAEQRAGANAPQAPAAQAVSAASAASAPKKKNLADVMRERESNDRPQPRSHEAQADGANVLRSRMGAL
jgi:hypothetical protein